jgi:non-specific serine/threonine protein kinase
MLEQSVAMGRQLGNEPAVAWASTFLGQAATFAKDPQRALVLLEGALASHRAAGDLCGAWVCLFLLAEARSYLDDPRSAELGEQALELAEDCGWDWWKSFSLWVLGLEMLRQANWQRATALLRDSLRLRQLFDDPYGIAMCLELLARTAEADGHHERAARLLGAVRVLNDSMGVRQARQERTRVTDDGFASQARDALGDAEFDRAYRDGEALSHKQLLSYALADEGAPSDRLGTASGNKVLTRRQAEVAKLVAQGLSNNEIAAALVIANRTAEGHIENILTRLGFTSRAQIAAWVVAHERSTMP